MIEEGKGRTLVEEMMENVDSACHKEIALSLIGKEEFSLVAENLDKFEGLDDEVAMGLLRGNDNVSIRLSEHLDRFTNLDYRAVAENLVKRIQGHLVMENMESYEGVEPQDVVLWMLEAGYGEYVAHDLDKFNGLDKQDLARTLLDKGYEGFVREYEERFGLTPEFWSEAEKKD